MKGGNITGKEREKKKGQGKMTREMIKKKETDWGDSRKRKEGKGMEGGEK